jgi:hypothetical protein
MISIPVPASTKDLENNASNIAHSTITCAAFEAGKHVLWEKITIVYFMQVTIKLALTT